MSGGADVTSQAEIVAVSKRRSGNFSGSPGAGFARFRSRAASVSRNSLALGRSMDWAPGTTPSALLCSPGGDRIRLAGPGMPRFRLKKRGAPGP